MAKTRWINVSFPIGGHQEQYKGFQIDEIEVYYTNTGATLNEFANSSEW